MGRHNPEFNLNLETFFLLWFIWNFDLNWKIGEKGQNGKF